MKEIYSCQDAQTILRETIMNTNPFRPPQSNVEDIKTPQQAVLSRFATPLSITLLVAHVLLLLMGVSSYLEFVTNGAISAISLLLGGLAEILLWVGIAMLLWRKRPAKALYLVTGVLFFLALGFGTQYVITILLAYFFGALLAVLSFDKARRTNF